MTLLRTVAKETCCIPTLFKDDREHFYSLLPLPLFTVSINSLILPKAKYFRGLMLKQVNLTGQLGDRKQAKMNALGKTQN